MTKLCGYVMVGALCALCAIGCKKKPAEPPATGSGSAMAAGSAMAGSGSAADTGSAPPADPEGSRHWNCKKDCKLALKCKSAAGFHDLKECEQDCTSLAKDKDGRYERGAAEGVPWYTCMDKVSDCAGVKKCDHP